MKEFLSSRTRRKKLLVLASFAVADVIITLQSMYTLFNPSRSLTIASDQTLTTPIPFTFRCSSYFTRNPRNTKSKSKPKPYGDNLDLVIDIDRLKQDLSSKLKTLKLRKRSEFKRFVNSGTDAYDDLRNMIVVDDGRRIMISCRKSSLVFLGNLVVWSFVVCLGFRVLIGLVMWFRGCLGFGGGGEYVVRRDRSLGGKEVVVAAQGNKVKRIGSVGVRQSSVIVDDEGCLSDGLGMGMGIKSRIRREEKLPGWFPVSVSQQPLSADGEEGQRMANGLVRGEV